MADPATLTQAPPSPKRPGPNPRGNPHLNLSPRCGARTRSGDPCQAPALHGKHRCRMHGGGSTGPRTAEGMARMRAARTVHGRCTAEQRAFDRHILTTLRRARLLAEVAHWFNHLPPDLTARLTEAPELLPPPSPRDGITPQQDKLIRQQERAVQAPWRQAVAAARAVRQQQREKGQGEGRLARDCIEPLASVALPLSGEGMRQNGNEPLAPVAARVGSVAAHLHSAATHAQVGAQGPARAAQQNRKEPYAPIGMPGPAVAAPRTAILPEARPERRQDVPLVRSDCIQPRAPVAASAPGGAAEQNRVEPYVPISVRPGSISSRSVSPDAGEDAMVPAGLSRKQRRHLKWLRRQAAKGR